MKIHINRCNPLMACFGIRKNKPQYVKGLILFNRAYNRVKNKKGKNNRFSKIFLNKSSIIIYIKDKGGHLHEL